MNCHHEEVFRLTRNLLRVHGQQIPPSAEAVVVTTTPVDMVIEVLRTQLTYYFPWPVARCSVAIVFDTPAIATLLFSFAL